MLSLQDDSSEEDEEIVIDTAVSSTLPPKPELSMSTHDPTSNEKILFAEEDEDDEEDAPLPETVDEQAPMAIDPSVIPKRQSEISNIYLDASESLANDAWDTEAWGIYIEEVEQGRGGTVTAIDAYTKFLAQFPRAMNVWKLLVDYYIDRSDFISAEQQFSKCLLKCRSVELWLSYLSMIKKKSIDRFTRDHGNDQEYLIERQSYENAIEKAIDNVGMAIDSYPLWRLYVDHVKDSKEMGNFDTGRKLLVLRKVYQRVLCVPIEGLSNFWKEYEALERYVCYFS
jgi:cleavage stimulation factor subunit 3